MDKTRKINEKELKKYLRIHWFKKKPRTKRDNEFLRKYIKLQNKTRTIISLWSTGSTSKDSLGKFGEFFEVLIIGSTNKGIDIYIQNFKTCYKMNTNEQDEVNRVVNSIFFGECDLERFEEISRQRLKPCNFDKRLTTLCKNIGLIPRQ